MLTCNQFINTSNPQNGRTLKPTRAVLPHQPIVGMRLVRRVVEFEGPARDVGLQVRDPGERVEVRIDVD
jgi:hypothetical protein